MTPRTIHWVTETPCGPRGSEMNVIMRAVKTLVRLRVLILTWDPDSGSSSRWEKSAEILERWIDDQVSAVKRELASIYVIRRHGTIFAPLPRAMWRRIEHACCCRHCDPKDGQPRRAPYWDTLAIAAKAPSNRADLTWTVHAPEMHR